jgi:hypothetical protein
MGEITVQEFADALLELAKAGDVSHLADAYGKATILTNKALIESALIEGIKVYGKNMGVHRVYPIDDLFERNRLSEGIIIAAAEAYGNNGLIYRLVRCHKMEGLSDAVKKEIEKSLIEGMRVCATRGEVREILGVRDRKGLSNEVKEKVETFLIQAIYAHGENNRPPISIGPEKEKPNETEGANKQTDISTVRRSVREESPQEMDGSNLLHICMKRKV